MSDLLLDELPTRWHGHEIIPDFRPMVWLVNAYVRCQTGDDPIGFAVSALWRFYKDPHCFLNDPRKIIDAYGYMIEFYKAGEKAAESAAAESSTAPSSGLAFDYQCDAGYIVAAYNGHNQVKYVVQENGHHSNESCETVLPQSKLPYPKPVPD